MQVELQRRMLEEYEKRELARKVCAYRPTARALLYIASHHSTMITACTARFIQRGRHARFAGQCSPGSLSRSERAGSHKGPGDVQQQVTARLVH